MPWAESTLSSYGEPARTLPRFRCHLQSLGQPISTCPTSKSCMRGTASCRSSTPASSLTATTECPFQPRRFICPRIRTSSTILATPDRTMTRGFGRQHFSVFFLRWPGGPTSEYRRSAQPLRSPDGGRASEANLVARGGRCAPAAGDACVRRHGHRKAR
jgi:hypothetical protein